MRFSWRHWWNLALVVIAGAGVALWRLGLLDGRVSLLGVAAWVLLGVLIAPSILYEHLGFLDRHVFHDYWKARIRYRKAVETGKATTQALCALASLCLAEGDDVAAISLLEEAAIKEPQDPHLLALLSRGLSRAGRHEESVAAALRCSELAGAGPGWDMALADALKTKGEDVGAAASYQKALGKDPDLTGCRLGLAEIYWSMGQIDAGEGEIREVLRRAPKNPDALYWAGRFAAARGDAAGARTYLRSALENRPIHDRALTVSYQDVVKAVADIGSRPLSPPSPPPAQ